MTTLSEFELRIGQMTEDHRERVLSRDELRNLLDETASTLGALAGLMEAAAAHVPVGEAELCEGVEGLAHGCRSTAALAMYVGLGLYGSTLHVAEE